MNVPTSLRQQLISNQMWETVAFLAKAAFMLALTPLMLRAWGAAGYGEFAVASSAFALLSVLDFGIRGRTRVALCREGNLASDAAAAIVAQSIVALALIAGIAVFVASVCDALQLNALLGFSSANRHLLTLTTLLTALVLLSGLMLEPLIARGEIGRVKFATAAGWMAAIPAVGLVVAKGGSPATAVVVWLGSLVAANLVAVLRLASLYTRICAAAARLDVHALLAPVRGGFWFNISTATWLARTYGATIAVSAFAGPSAAGFFFILLRLSEIVSALGAISCDVALAQLAQTTNAEQRRHAFTSTYSWAVLLCVHSALALGFVTPDLLEHWLGTGAVSPLAGAVVVALGLGSAFNRTATYAAMGLGLGRTAAKWGLVEAGVFLSVLIYMPGQPELLTRLAAASLAACALVVLARALARELQSRSWEMWLKPFLPVVPFAAASCGLYALALLTDSLAIKAVALCAGGVLLLANLLSSAKAHGRSDDSRTRETKLPAPASGDLPLPC